MRIFNFFGNNGPVYEKYLALNGIPYYYRRRIGKFNRKGGRRKEQVKMAYRKEALPHFIFAFYKLNEAAIELENLEVKKATIYKPSLQKMSDENW